MSLPPEILDLIAYHVDETVDLLALALTSRDSCAVIIPDHLHFRHLRCDLRRTSLWCTLASQPRLAARFRILEIAPEEIFTGGESESANPCVPPSLDYETQPDDTVNSDSLTTELKLCCALLADAIQYMTRLSAFRWLSPKPPSNAVYRALLDGCPNLDDLEVVHTDDFEFASTSDVDLANAPLWRLSNLTHFAFEEFDQNIDITTYVAYTSALTNLLLSCPNLIDLRIIQYHKQRLLIDPADSIHTLFATACWPRLTRLCAEVFALSSCYRSFFEAHPRLESLSIKSLTTYVSGVTIAGLPSLRSLDIDCMITPGDITQEVVARLTYLSLDLPDFEAFYSAGEWWRFPDVLGMAKGLRSLILRQAVYSRAVLAAILERVPALERLGLLWKSRDSVHERMSEDPRALKDVISLLPDLTHLSWLEASWFDDTDMEEEEEERVAKASAYSDGQVNELLDINETEGSVNDSTDSNEPDPGVTTALRSLSAAAPRLTYVEFSTEHRFHDDTVWVVIQRDENGKYIGYDEAEGSLGRAESWGNCYLSRRKVI